MRSKTLGFLCLMTAVLFHWAGPVLAKGPARVPGLGRWAKASMALQRRLTVLKGFRDTGRRARSIERELHATERTLRRLEGTKGPQLVSPKTLEALAKRLKGHEGKLRSLLARLPRSDTFYGGTTPDDVIEALRDLARKGSRGVLGQLIAVLRVKIGECAADKDAFLELDCCPGTEAVQGQ